MKYAVVDIGSNTIRLIIFKNIEDGFYKLLNKKYTAGLINYISLNKLNDKGIKKLIKTLSSIKVICDEVDVRYLNVFATASLRNIDNQLEVLKAIKDVTGIEIDLLSQEEEARLGNIGAVNNIGDEEGITIDIGGASTEIVHFRKKKPFEILNLEVGSLLLFSRHISEVFPKKKEIVKIENDILKEINSKNIDASYKYMIGIGGSIRSTGKILDELWNKNDYEFSLNDIELLLKNFKNRDMETIRAMIKVNAARLHTIVPGILILKNIMEILDIKKVKVSDEGLREGYLIKKVLEVN